MITREKAPGAARHDGADESKKSLPASLFEVPAGYTKQEGMMGAASAAGLRRERRDAQGMESMTPEQRKQFEEMMRQRQSQ